MTPDNESEQREQYKQFPVKMPIDLFEAFYRVFPHYGTRSIFIRETIREALRQLSDGSVLDIPTAVRVSLKSPALRVRIDSSNENK